MVESFTVNLNVIFIELDTPPYYVDKYSSLISSLSPLFSQVFMTAFIILQIAFEKNECFLRVFPIFDPENCLTGQINRYI